MYFKILLLFLTLHIISASNEDRIQKSIEHPEHVGKEELQKVDQQYEGTFLRTRKALESSEVSKIRKKRCHLKRKSKSQKSKPQLVTNRSLPLKRKRPKKKIRN